MSKWKKFWRSYSKELHPPEAPKHHPDFRYELLLRINHEREKEAYRLWREGYDYNFYPLNRDARLEIAAQKHSEWMAKNLELSYGLTRSRNTIHSRILAEGYSCRRFKDCNSSLSSYDGTPYGVILDWMWVDYNRANVLSLDWTDIGIGMKAARNGLKYWCAKFARPYDFGEHEFTEDELFELLTMFWPFGLNSEDLMKPNFDSLEGRQMMASNVMSALANGVLAIVGTNQADNIRVSNPTPTTVQLDIRGQASQSWPSSTVKSIAITGLNGNDSIINLTQIPSVIIDGNGDDYVNTGDPSRLGTGANDIIRVGNGNNVIQDSGGTDSISAGNGNNVIFAYGKDNILAGNGDNVLYNIVGSGNIIAGNGHNHVITNAKFQVIVGNNSAPTIIFTTRPNPVTLNANGTLNFAATTGNTLVTIDDNYDGTITTNYVNDATGVSETDTFLKSSVLEIGAIFGKGSGTFVNNTDIDNVVYGGAAGGNTLIGGSSFNFMKSNSPGDVIDGSQGSYNVLSLGGVNGTLIGGQGQNVLVGGFSGTSVILSVGNVDTVIGDISVASILAARKTKLYN